MRQHRAHAVRGGKHVGTACAGTTGGRLHAAVVGAARRRRTEERATRRRRGPWLRLCGAGRHFSAARRSCLFAFGSGGAALDTPSVKAKSAKATSSCSTCNAQEHVRARVPAETGAGAADVRRAAAGRARLGERGAREMPTRSGAQVAGRVVKLAGDDAVAHMRHTL
eukprot:217964-Chlamydomonas_euryale.AAC.4